MKPTLTLVLALFIGRSVIAETLLVENGEPHAEIVIAEKRPRMTTLAAVELRHFIEEMSGTRLPIVTAPGAANSGS